MVIPMLSLADMYSAASSTSQVILIDTQVNSLNKEVYNEKATWLKMMNSLLTIHAASSRSGLKYILWQQAWKPVTAAHKPFISVPANQDV